MDEILRQIFTVRRPCLTEKEMKKYLQGKLYPGKTVIIERYSMLKDCTYEIREREKGVVVALYEHNFTVRVGQFLQAFRYAQCFTQDDERVRL